MAADDLILLGKIVATHGIRGQLRVVPYSGQFDTFLAVDSLLVKDATARLVKHDLASATVHGRKLLLSFKGYGDINQVLHLVGCELYIGRDQLPEPGDDEYYWHDLIGLTVVTVAGEQLGSLESIIETGSNDVYVVKSAGREYLIPALAEVVTSIDLDAKVMTVTPFEGLFDL
ncbi:MAG TPA: ribosome maturation factor RimM [Geobacteraceae bacterium]|nr:ribosome maturation factor RimM [Geobacteraceae bacterium]